MSSKQPVESTGLGEKKSSKYGIRWSQGAGAAALIAVVVWGEAYNVLNDTYAEKWWFNFLIAFVMVAALVTVAVLTCCFAEYLEARDRKNEGARRR